MTDYVLGTLPVQQVEPRAQPTSAKQTVNCCDKNKRKQTSVDHSNYLLSLAARNLAIKHAKKEYHTRLSMKVINAESSTRNWWSCLVNDVLDNNYKPSIPALEKDGQCYVTDQEKATLLNDCFVQHTHLDIPVNHIDDISSSESITVGNSGYGSCQAI